MAAQVRAEIAARNETVASIARATGINRETLDRWVKGERPLSVPNLWRISIALGLTANILVTRAQTRFIEELQAESGIAILDNRERWAVRGSRQDLAEVANESIDEDPSETDADFDHA